MHLTLCLWDSIKIFVSHMWEKMRLSNLTIFFCHFLTLLPLDLESIVLFFPFFDSWFFDIRRYTEINRHPVSVLKSLNWVQTGSLEIFFRVYRIFVYAVFGITLTKNLIISICFNDISLLKDTTFWHKNSWKNFQFFQI